MSRTPALVHIGMLSGLLLGCTVGPDPSYTDLQPLVFPAEGRLGELGGAGSSVMVMIDSNAMGTTADSYDASERLDLDVERITASLRDPATAATTEAWVRTFFSAELAPNVAWHNVMQGGSASIAIIDLPASDALATTTPYPFTAILDIAIDGNVVFQPRITITGGTGKPTELVSPTLFNGSLENLLRPTLGQPFLVRVRPKRATGTFAPGGPFIGGIEFDVTYPSNCYFDVYPTPASDAANATAIASEPQPAGAGLLRTHIAAVDPRGIELAFLSDIPGFDTVDETLAGEGPILDLLFEDAQGGCTLSATQFTFSNLRVADINGNLMFSVPSPSADTAANPSPSANLRLYTVEYPAPL
jgi:hypothetical protein